MSTAEVEASLMLHPAVSEAAVVSRPHKVKGECLYCFVTLKDRREFNHTLVEELKRLGEALWLCNSIRVKGKTHSKHFFVCACLRVPKTSPKIKIFSFSQKLRC